MAQALEKGNISPKLRKMGFFAQIYFLKIFSEMLMIENFFVSFLKKVKNAQVNWG